MYLNTQETGDHLREHGELMVYRFSPQAHLESETKTRFWKLQLRVTQPERTVDLKFPLLVPNIDKIKNMIPTDKNNIFFSK